MLNVNLHNKAYLESELEKVDLLRLAEEIIEQLKETVPYYEQGQRILLEFETFIKDDLKRFVSAVFFILENEDEETEEVNIEFEILRSYDTFSK
ncbi:hypothetical protein QNH18_03015 [Bacillus paralicheniformis]|uniref:hypothetical protein n=1 Tax=Bacillus paralicheniformis TaxID=1648923 RepID=UPI000C77BC8A|nr:hypothetical protein [Bacillus paralicheniformis]MDE1384349.1 hypothetical protein [Bacillus paralicheniformis]PLC14587.1 hypothetical protein BV582_17235 [Bacillus paralicheniformis]WHX87316.1 hypothetical protein QNH18_03015 [Bacillus paralicheniformis]